MLTMNEKSCLSFLDKILTHARFLFKHIEVFRLEYIVWFHHYIISYKFRHLTRSTKFLYRNRFNNAPLFNKVYDMISSMHVIYIIILKRTYILEILHTRAMLFPLIIVTIYTTRNYVAL